MKKQKIEPVYCGACFTVLKKPDDNSCHVCGTTFEEGVETVDPKDFKSRKGSVISILRKNLAESISRIQEMDAEIDCWCKKCGSLLEASLSGNHGPVDLEVVPCNRCVTNEDSLIKVEDPYHITAFHKCQFNGCEKRAEYITHDGFGRMYLVCEEHYITQTCLEHLR
jgi:hypothetical protein